MNYQRQVRNQYTAVARAARAASVGILASVLALAGDVAKGSTFQETAAADGVIWSRLFGTATELMRRSDVRQELELVEDQQSDLEKLADDVRLKTRDAMRGLQAVPAQQRLQKMREQMSELRRQIEAEIKQILLPHQNQRLSQLQLQWIGRQRLGGALLESNVLDTLELNGQQLQALRRRQGELDRQLQEKIATARREAEQELLKGLTPAQRNRFQTLLGKPFDFETGNRGPDVNPRENNPRDNNQRDNENGPRDQ